MVLIIIVGLNCTYVGLKGYMKLNSNWKVTLTTLGFLLQISDPEFIKINL